MNVSRTETEKNRAAVTEAFATWSRGDNGPLFASIADDVQWTLAGTCQGGGTFNTKADFLARSARPVHDKLQKSALPEVLSIWADADVVIVRWRGHAITKRGAPYDNEYCWILRLRDGVIVEATSFLDTLAVAKLFEAMGT